MLHKCKKLSEEKKKPGRKTEDSIEDWSMMAALGMLITYEVWIGGKQSLSQG